MTIKTATGVKRFQDDKNYGVWFDHLFESVKTRDSCHPDLATEALMKGPWMVQENSGRTIYLYACIYCNM